MSTSSSIAPLPPGAANSSTTAVVFQGPERLALQHLELDPPGDAELLVAVEWSGISAGTERLLWSGRMPPFPGMGYPLVPGYESVGRVLEAGADTGMRAGQAVFVPGARCFGEVRGLFGGAASRLVVPAARVYPIDGALGGQGVLLALAATAGHVLAGGPAPQLIVGHGVLGRLLARLVLQAGGQPPVVWEREPTRRQGGQGYPVLDPETDPCRDYPVICDVSGDPGLLDTLLGRLQHGGELVLAGFYPGAVSFDFPSAFLREARLRVAAEWRPADLAAVSERVASGALSLDGLITHRRPAGQAESAYRTAFSDPDCLKMILDWRAFP